MPGIIFTWHMYFRRLSTKQTKRYVLVRLVPYQVLLVVTLFSHTTFKTVSPPIHPCASWLLKEEIEVIRSRRCLFIFILMSFFSCSHVWSCYNSIRMLQGDIISRLWDSCKRTRTIRYNSFGWWSRWSYIWPTLLLFWKLKTEVQLIRNKYRCLHSLWPMHLCNINNRTKRYALVRIEPDHVFWK